MIKKLILVLSLFTNAQLVAIIVDTDPLPSWNEGSAKKAILEFVKVTCDPANQKFVHPENRIATFDLDGTLWVEKPLYTQCVFALDRVKMLSPEKSNWIKKEPFKGILDNNNDEKIGKLTSREWELIIAKTHSGMSNEAFAEIVKQWLSTTKHPRYQRPYTELIYQPMLEVMNFLRSNGYRTYIVTGGGQEFVRVFSPSTLGIGVNQIVGSSVSTKYEHVNGHPVLIRLPKVFFVDDYTGKPIGINMFIGKRPQIAFGNSDGDRQMMEFTQGGDGLRLMMLVLHDDAEREYAYGPAADLPPTTVGVFSKSLLLEAKKRGWNVISMKKDWKRIFPFST